MRHAYVQVLLCVPSHLCEPRSLWQRPTNEHANGLLRRWLPKSNDLDIPAV